jgi:hypothetical protein
MAWCLTKDAEEKFLKGLQDGSIDPAKLVNMTSEDRRAFLGKFVGDWNAKFVNTEFESKLLLKNQQRGLINWASKAAGLKEAARTDLVDKINKLDRALNPETEKQFLSDIVQRRLGVQVTPAEAQVITQYADRLNQLYDKTKKPFEQSRQYWETRQGLQKYMRDITPEALPTTKIGKAGQLASDTISILRAVKTGFDLSALGRQGRAYFGTREWNQAGANSLRYAKSQSALDSLETDMMSSPYADLMLKPEIKKALGLTLLGEKFTAREETFASKAIDKIPGLKQSERAYVGFLNDLRYNRFVNILDNLKAAGNDITGNTKAVKDLAEVIGSATGRGHLGPAEGASQALATVLFSPRWYASRFQVLLDPVTRSGPARVEAAKNIMRLAGTQAAILGLAHMAGAKTETDPRSSDFLKSLVGNTRFDTTGGIGPFITAIVRTEKVLRDQPAVKSSTTGKITKLNTGKFGSQTLFDLWINFFADRASPIASIVRDIGKGHDFNGNPVKIKANKDFANYLITQLVEPLFASDVLGAFNDAAGGVAGPLSVPASLFGVGVNTYKNK